jgi:hypothetical protein
MRRIGNMNVKLYNVQTSAHCLFLRQYPNVPQTG